MTVLTLFSLEVRHKKTGKLLFGTHGMIPVEAERTAAYLAVHLPLYRVVVLDRFTQEILKEYPEHERTD